MPFAFLQNFPTKPGHQRTWGNLKGSGHAWALQQAAHRHDGLLLVVTRDMHSVHQLELEIPCFDTAGNATEILYISAWETPLYNSFSPHQELISKRLPTLHELQQIQHGV